MEPKKIYLIDDDEISNFLNANLISKIAPHLGVVSFTSGSEALRHFKTQPTEQIQNCLILLDIRMPVMSGFEFLEEIETAGIGINNSTSIIVLSSSDNPRDIEIAKKHEVFGYLNKPLSEEALKPYLKMAG